VDLDRPVRQAIFRVTAERGTPPAVSELSTICSASEPDVRSSLSRLAAARVLVLQPMGGEILMAPPFSAVPTPFVVRTVRHSSYANCVWDALGVPVTLHQPAKIVTACGCCGESMAVQAHRNSPPQGHGVVHFAVPASRWWEDIVFT
jgi:hypothetical protein